MAIKQHMRYAHSEGHLDLCYDDSGDFLITCGPDGDVRVYHGFEDDDPVSHKIGDVVHFVAYKDNKFYVASDDNTVRAFSLKDGQFEGVLTRFTAHATHFCFSSSGNKLVAGASDFMVKIVDTLTNKQEVLTGHEAPVLSVSLDPNELFIASSSCDGTVRVWNTTDQQQVKTISGLPKSNDVAASKTLCRLTWDQRGKYLFVPINKVIFAYDAKTWNVAFELTDISVTELISIVCLSPCGQYLAAATRNGQLLVWSLRDKKCIFREKHEKSLTITGVAWHPKLPHIAFCDSHGYLGLLKDVILAKSLNDHQDELTEGNDLFDDQDDGLLVNAAETDVMDDDENDVSGAIPGIDTDVDDDAGVDDEEEEKDKEISALKAAARGALTDNDTSAAGNAAHADDVSKPSAVFKGWEQAALQQPFQSSSSPAALSARFMVWNDVGLIIQYNSDDEQSINVEFHDTATHHAIHVNNTLAYNLADLSSSAVLLASEADDNSPSQLTCMHFGSWDSCKEWNTSMPEGEDIQMLCLGEDWLAVATDRRLVRIFSICGIQKQIFCLPGPVVTMAGHRDLLLVVYHNGLGIPGDQCLGFQLLSVCKKATTRCADRLPLSPKSTLAWLRFSKEGTPFSMDSAGIVRMFSRDFSCNWIEVANLRQHCKGKSDNMWLVGIHENQQHIRAVMCKGNKYPPVLPRPTVQLLPFQLPLCDLSTDKGNLENTFWQTVLFSEHFSHLEAEGLEIDDRQKSQAVVAHQESLMKLFALACKSGREVRATELCRMMPSSRTVQLAIKYATRLHLIQLADRLGDIAHQKAEEEMQLRTVERQAYRPRSAVADNDTESRAALKMHEADSQEKDASNDERGNNENAFQEQYSDNTLSSATPRGMFLIRKKDNKEHTPKSLSDSQSDKRNPFKVAGVQPDVEKTPFHNKGTSVFDSMEKVKLGRLSSSTGRSSITDSSEIPSRAVKKIRTQSKLQDNSGKQKILASENDCNENAEISTFDVWFEMNKQKLLAEYGESCEESELTVKAMHKYRQLIKGQRKTNTRESTENAVSSKRRKDDVNDSEENLKNSLDAEPFESGSNKLHGKLSGFVFNKNV